jgi:arylsulfatase A-like enzyme/Tfp pilus assembly protein PilF
LGIGLFILLILITGCSTPDESTTEQSLVIGTEDEEATPGEIRREPGLDVLLITIDTLRADALGSYGNERASTPWMDGLARGGVRFEKARAHNVNTLPSHASLFSGLYPQEHGVRDNSGFRFPGGIETLATLLKAEGYRTGAFVSAFPLDSRFGLERGFDVYEDSFVDEGRQAAFLLQERSGAETVALAKAWLDEEDERPSLAWIHLFEPHFPYEPPEPFAGQFRNDPYHGDVAAADDALGPLLAPLLEQGDGSRTLVILTSDHGEALGEHGEATHGIFAYEGSLKVPLILHQPRLLTPGVISESVRLVDLLPTVLDLLSVAEPAGLRGRSLLPLMAGSAGDAAPETYFESLSPQLNLGWAPLYGLIQDDWKYIDLPIPELYDLHEDPREETNLAESETERASRLREELRVLRVLDSGAEPSAESPETRERLRALGYLSGGGSQAKQSYAPQDDPKRLLPLFATLREVGDLYDAGDLVSARSLCRELDSRRPGMRIVLMYLAQIERDLGNLDAAVEAMREAYDLKPNDVETLALLASYLIQAGRPLEAVQLTDSHSRQPNPDSEVLFTRGLALARLQRPQEALAALQKARKIDPENPMVPVYLGTFYLMGGQRAQARQAYEDALRINPETVRAHTSLAIMATEEGRLDEALAHWRHAVEIDPQQHATLYSFASGLWSTGQKDQSRPLLELFVDSAPVESFIDELSRARILLSQIQ